MDVSYCLCGQPYDPNTFMIQCDACKDWFHSSCTNFQEYWAVEIDKYHCPRCTPKIGPSIHKPIRNWHRHNFWEGDAANKPVQTGTTVFIRELCSRHFTSEAGVVIHLRGQQLTETFLKTHGFNNPIMIDSKDGLDMILPPENFNTYDVVSCLGGDKEIDVIDVWRQSNIKMKLRDYVDYYNNLNRTRVFNVVSLEFSGTSLAPMIEAPLIARKLDWVNNVWPPDHPGRPQVQKYCLMSVKDSYTDFHIDFGGTSVWYHVLKGEKIFYFVKPTTANLTLYSQWMTSTNQSETFFGDQVDSCIKCVLKRGQTMLIPTGWIHAVYTPVDSLVFGGNFLHTLNISMQLGVYEIEKKTKTEAKFLYPNFETINWFAAIHLFEHLTKMNMEEKRCPDYLLTGMKSLQQTLKQWNNEKDYNAGIGEHLPPDINPAKLLKDIGKEIRHAERYIHYLNPPKPERESKRRRKKPVKEDFVDYSSSPKTSNQDLISTTQPATFSRPAPPLKLTLPKVALYPYERTNFPQMPNNATNNERSISKQWLMDSYMRPEDTVAIRKGDTILKLKLRTKDLNSPSIVTSPLKQQSPQVFGSNYMDNCEDIYDFRGDSDIDEDCFNILDVTPQKKPKKARIKMKLPVKKQKAKVQDADESRGIESLIQASSLSVPATQGGTSPSTQEAIAGMLSISQTWPVKKPKRSQSPLEEDVNNVHQDEDYIYPSLDNSDDEEVHIFKPRGRSKVDEAWNPKARVGPLLPKMNRPAREGTKKQSVEKVLEAAAARRVNDTPKESPKRQYRKKKVKPKVEVKTVSPSNTTALPSTSTVQLALTNNNNTINNNNNNNNNTNMVSTTSTHSNNNTNTSKPRKGMKTAKQRLGKILKIHKMIH